MATQDPAFSRLRRRVETFASSKMVRLLYILKGRLRKSRRYECMAYDLSIFRPSILAYVSVLYSSTLMVYTSKRLKSVDIQVLAGRHLLKRTARRSSFSCSCSDVPLDLARAMSALHVLHICGAKRQLLWNRGMRGCRVAKKLNHDMKARCIGPVSACGVVSQMVE